MTAKEELVQIAVRVPKSLPRRAQKAAERMSRGNVATVTRADILRAALLDGMSRIEKKK